MTPHEFNKLSTGNVIKYWNSYWIVTKNPWYYHGWPSAEFQNIKNKQILVLSYVDTMSLLTPSEKIKLL